LHRCVLERLSLSLRRQLLPLLIGKVIGSGAPRVCRPGERGDGRKRAISRLLLFCQRGLFDPGEIGERQPSQDHNQDSQFHRNNIRNFRVHFLSLLPLMCGRRTQSRRQSRTNLARNHPAAQSYSRPAKQRRNTGSVTAHRPGCWLPNPNRLLGLYAAITRATLGGKNLDGWIPEEKITLPEAVEVYTMGSAFAEFQEKEKGCITPGKLADMVILSDNIFGLKPEAIRNVKVETTIVGGKVVYGLSR
jgi:hypothetical protein